MHHHKRKKQKPLSLHHDRSILFMASCKSLYIIWQNCLIELMNWVYRWGDNLIRHIQLHRLHAMHIMCMPFKSEFECELENTLPVRHENIPSSFLPSHLLLWRPYFPPCASLDLPLIIIIPCALRITQVHLHLTADLSNDLSSDFVEYIPLPSLYKYPPRHSLLSDLSYLVTPFLLSYIHLNVSLPEIVKQVL